MSAAAALAAIAAGTGQQFGEVSAELFFESVAAGLGASVASLVASAGIQAASAGTGSLAGTLTAAAALQSASSGVGAIAGELSTVANLQALAAGLAAVAPEMSAAALIAAVAAGTGAAVGVLDIPALLSAAAAGVGTTAGVLTASAILQAAIDGTGTAAGTLAASALLSVLAAGTGEALAAPTILSSWTPDDLFGAGETGDWWNFADLTKMWTDTGGTAAVAAAGDSIARADGQVGAIQATQSTSGNRPIYRNPSGVLGYAEFDGGSDKLVIASGAFGWFRNVGTGFICAVGFTGSIAAATPVLSSFTIGTATNPRLALGRNAAAIRLSSRRLDGDATVNLDASSQLVANTSYVICGYADWTNNDGFIRKDGSQVATNANFLTAGSTSDTASQQATIGSTTSSSSSGWAGGIYAILFRREIVTGGDLTSLESYFADLMGA
jgi:hypothetical protein